MTTFAVQKRDPRYYGGLGSDGDGLGGLGGWIFGDKFPVRRDAEPEAQLSSNEKRDLAARDPFLESLFAHGIRFIAKAAQDAIESKKRDLSARDATTEDQTAQFFIYENDAANERREAFAEPIAEAEPIAAEIEELAPESVIPQEE